MFALQFDFKDNLSGPELFLVKRPYARIGASDQAQILIDNLKDLGFELEVSRGLGSGININTVGQKSDNDLARLFKNYFNDQAKINTGNFELLITALDLDLLIKQGEAFDKASIRVLKQVAAHAEVKFPALVSRTHQQASSVLSIGYIDQLVIGRSAKADIRVDNIDVSGEHLKIYCNGSNYEIEDLGSTNGTYINGKRVNNRVVIKPLDVLSLGSNLNLILIDSEEQLKLALAKDLPEEQNSQLRRYPVLISNSDLVRPKRLVLPLNSEILIGRDPDSDVWIGSPLVSRRHCTISFDGHNSVTVFDESKNGILTSEGNLQQGEELKVEDRPEVFIFSDDVYVGVCFNEEQEREFNSSSHSLRDYAAKIMLLKEGAKQDESEFVNTGSMAMKNNQKSLNIPLLLFGIIGFLFFMVLIGSLFWSLWL